MRKEVKRTQPAGRYLETPQRWGVVPTMAFWCRRDVGRSAGLLLIPAWMITANLMTRVAIQGPWWAVPPVMGGAVAAMFLIQGLFEKYIRRRAARTTAEERLERLAKVDTQEAEVVVTPRRTLVLIFGMAFVTTGLLTWQVRRADRAQEGREQARQQQDQRRRALDEQHRQRQMKQWQDARGSGRWKSEESAAAPAADPLPSTRAAGEP
jgi:hypothetical protein